MYKSELANKQLLHLHWLLYIWSLCHTATNSFCPHVYALFPCLECPFPCIVSFLCHSQVVDHYENPINVGSLDKNAKNVGTGLVGAPACGDVMKLQVCQFKILLMPFVSFPLCCYLCPIMCVPCVVSLPCYVVAWGSCVFLWFVLYFLFVLFLIPVPAGGLLVGRHCK